MSMDWKVPRERNREDKGSWPLCGSDGGRSVGKTARTLAASERAGGAAASLTDKFQGVRFEHSPPAATQEVEGLDRPDNNRTNSNTFACSVRELRIERSHSGSTSEVSRPESAFAI